MKLQSGQQQSFAIVNEKYIGTYGSNCRLPSLIQRASDPKPSAGAVTTFVKSHLLLSETKVTKYGKPSTARMYFRSVRTAVYQFWAHLI